jgi:CDP-glucose 4,6-dehydratase
MDALEKVKVLVTGGTGFIGSWLVNDLINKGADVVVLIRDLNPKSNFFMLGLQKKSTVVYGDLLDLVSLKRIFNEFEIETCFHLAAQPIVTIANQDPTPTLETNIRGSWNIFEMCRINDVKRIVVASSDKAYGTHKQLPYKEDFPLLAENPYDASKACTDILARMFHKTYGMPIAVTRCTNVYGGGDLNWTRIIPGTIRSILMNERPIIRSDGTPVRDYLFIDDCVKAYLTAAEKIDVTKGEAFNFGTNEPVSVLDLTKKTLVVAGSNLEPVIQGTAKHEIDNQYSSSEKAKRILGWEAKVSLNEGLKRTYDWYKKNWEFLK